MEVRALSSLNLPRFFATIGGLIFAIAIGMIVGQNELKPILVASSLPLLVLVVYNPQSAALIALALTYSGLLIPGVPADKVNVSMATWLLLGVAVIFRAAFKRGSPLHLTASHRFMLLFCGVVVATMLVRGTGFKFLGGDTWGGMVYVQLVLGAATVFFLQKADVSPRWWPRVFIAMALFALIPVVAEFFFGSRLEYFVAGAGALESQEAAAGFSRDHISRYQSASVAAAPMLAAVLVCFSTGYIMSPRGLWVLPGIAVIFAFSLMGGFRSQLFILAGTFAITAFQQKAITTMRVVTIGSVFCITVFLAAANARSLPPVVQRALAWVPGAQIQEYVITDASSTIVWRLDLWQRGIASIPDYWILGKGFAFSERDLMAATGINGAKDPTEWAVVTSAFHNGPLGLLVGLGVVGLISGLGFIISVFLRHYKIMKETWNDPQLQRCHQIFNAMFIFHTVLFLTLYGDVQTSFPQFFFFLAIMEAVRASDQRLTKATPVFEGSPQQTPLTHPRFALPQNVVRGRPRPSRPTLKPALNDSLR